MLSVYLSSVAVEICICFRLLILFGGGSECSDELYLFRSVGLCLWHNTLAKDSLGVKFMVLLRT